jgi:hypothetical protein
MNLQVVLELRGRRSVLREIQNISNPSGVPEGCPKCRDANCSVPGIRNKKKERLEKIREDIFNAIHPTFPQMSKIEDATYFTKVG